MSLRRVILKLASSRFRTGTGSTKLLYGVKSISAIVGLKGNNDTWASPALVPETTFSRPLYPPVVKYCPAISPPSPLELGINGVWYDSCWYIEPWKLIEGSMLAAAALKVVILSDDTVGSV